MVEHLLSTLATCTIVYLSLTSATTRPMSRFARSGAVLTVTSLNVGIEIIVGGIAERARSESGEVLGEYVQTIESESDARGVP